MPGRWSRDRARRRRCAHVIAGSPRSDSAKRQMVRGRSLVIRICRVSPPVQTLSGSPRGPLWVRGAHARRRLAHIAHWRDRAVERARGRSRAAPCAGRRHDRVARSQRHQLHRLERHRDARARATTRKRAFTTRLSSSGHSRPCCACLRCAGWTGRWTSPIVTRRSLRVLGGRTR